MKNFTNKYQLSKTLRFELKPIGKTKDHIEAKGLLTQDKNRADSVNGKSKSAIIIKNKRKKRNFSSCTSNHYQQFRKNINHFRL